MRYSKIFCDAPINWQFSIQKLATSLAEGISGFHNYSLFINVIVCFLVFWLLYKTFFLFSIVFNYAILNFLHSSILEFVLIMTLAIILLFLAFLLFVLLYSIIFDDKSLAYDSYMVATTALTKGVFMYKYTYLKILKIILLCLK